MNPTNKSYRQASQSLSASRRRWTQAQANAPRATVRALARAQSAETAKSAQWAKEGYVLNPELLVVADVMGEMLAPAFERMWSR